MGRSAARALAGPEAGTEPGTDAGLSPGPAPALSAWLDDFFASYYRHRPVNATFIGLHQHDDRLPDYSERGVGDALADAELLLKRLASLPDEPLTAEQRLDRRLAEGFLRIQRWEYDSSHYRWANPSLNTGEAIFGVLGLLLQETVPLGERLERATARLQAIPTLLDQARQTVRSAPTAWAERALRECAAAGRLFGDGLSRFLAERGAEDHDLRAAADRALHGFAELASYLAGDLLPRATDAYGCGPEAFALLLREGHALDLDASELEALALGHLAAAEAHLVARAPQLGAASWQEALARLADAQPPAERFSARFGELWAEARATAEAHRLLTVPDWPVRYVPQPAWVREAAPSLYFLPYRSPPPLDPPPVVDSYVPSIEADDPIEQARRLRATNASVIKLNHVVHHGGIGHHTQNWFAARAASRIGRVAAVDCASRIAMLCGGTMAEGWACYATDLMGEVGFLTPLERYAKQHARLRMAARAIVDVRLHDARFSLEDGAAFYRDRVGMAPSAAHAEVVKNSLFPATACMYLAGWDGIRRLRRELAAREGSDFSLQRFHDRLLSFGSVPVALIQGVMD
jgi:uncharacterized protein (DUF885 family)